MAAEPQPPTTAEQDALVASRVAQTKRRLETALVEEGVTPPSASTADPAELEEEFWGGAGGRRRARRTGTVAAVSSEAAVSPSSADATVGPSGTAAAGERAAAAAPSGDPRPLARGERWEARQVVRVLRHVSVWSVFKVSALLSLCLWLILLVAGALLWGLGDRVGLIGNVERFLSELLGESSFTFDPAGVFRSSVALGAVMTVACTAGAVLVAVLFNLISDVTGGVKVSVLELERGRRTGRSARRRG